MLPAVGGEGEVAVDGGDEAGGGCFREAGEGFDTEGGKIMCGQGECRVDFPEFV